MTSGCDALLIPVRCENSPVATSPPTIVKPRSPTLIAFCLGTFLLFALITLGSDPWQIQWVGVALLAFVLLMFAAQHMFTCTLTATHDDLVFKDSLERKHAWRSDELSSIEAPSRGFMGWFGSFVIRGTAGESLLTLNRGFWTTRDIGLVATKLGVPVLEGSSSTPGPASGLDLEHQIEEERGLRPMSLIDRVNRLSNAQASLILAFAGFATFFTGLGNPFQGDDIPQIVQSPPVHSISNIASFFQGGTFYLGHLPLSGVYYGPITTTVDSLLYSIFGPNPVYFHVLQLILCIASAFVLYLFLTYSVGRLLAFLLSLVFLVHPANSQIVYSIPYMNDALFFFFGLLGLWALVRFKSTRSLIWVVACLTLSLLSKETGILFVLLSLAYLFWWDRQRLYSFIAMASAPIAIYLLLKAGATGLTNLNPRNAPIDFIGLGGRLLTAPSIVLFYIAKILWPVPLASGYYWTHPDLSFEYFILPLLADVLVGGIFIYVGKLIQKKGSRAQSRTYWFFATWTALGVLAHLQIVPLDETASESYLYFPLVGILGMVGIAVSIFSPSVRFDRRAVLAGTAVLIALLGIRSFVRGTDWSSAYTIATHDIAASPEVFSADDVIALQSARDGDFGNALTHAYHATSIEPDIHTYDDLGMILLVEGDCPNAEAAFRKASTNPWPDSVYDDAGALSVYCGDPTTNKAFLVQALNAFPNDGNLWLDLAVVDQQLHDRTNAEIAITNAYTLGAATEAEVALVANGGVLTIPAHPTIPAGR